jgi:DNA-binding NtrC family response regulator
MIFVVDDEPAIGSSLVAILVLKGYRATSFTSPFEALRAARSEKPDLLLSDVMMPELCGIDLAILMTSQSPKTRVLLFSGQTTTNSDLMLTARDKGYNFRLLAKPVHPKMILDEISILLSPFAARPFASTADVDGLYLKDET